MRGKSNLTILTMFLQIHFKKFLKVKKILIYQHIRCFILHIILCCLIFYLKLLKLKPLQILCDSSKDNLVGNLIGRYFSMYGPVMTLR
jgi:hypothetical protein